MRRGGGGPVFGPREFMALTKQNTFLVHFSFWVFYMLLCQVLVNQALPVKLPKYLRIPGHFWSFANFLRNCDSNL